MFQEAFKAVEDIHGLINLSKRPVKPSLMANYYSKLALVFWKSGNILYHAATLHRLFVLTREQRKNLTTEELSKYVLTRRFLSNNASLSNLLDEIISFISLDCLHEFCAQHLPCRSLHRAVASTHSSSWTTQLKKRRSDCRPCCRSRNLPLAPRSPKNSFVFCF